MFSQSAYPIQRVEGKDTVVVMTRAQAMAMNARFMRMDSTIKVYAKANSLTYAQVGQMSKDIAAKDSVICVITEDLAKKPMWKPVTKLDIFMSAMFVSYAALMTLILN
jgi:hypothetical protein